MAWLTQTGPASGDHEEFRLAQLFRPGPATHNVFRLAIAAMRRRSWTIPLLALSAYGPVTRIVALVLVALTVVLVGLLGAGWPAVRPVRRLGDDDRLRDCWTPPRTSSG